MHTRHDTIVIGAGQAGLAASRCLTARGVEHVVLERGPVADSWRTQRWDSFRLLSPNWQTRLPGHRYRGPDPEGFMTGAQVVAFFEEYARSFAAPVRCGVTVRPGRPDPRRLAGRYDVGAVDGVDNVVVATGDLGHPRIPALPPTCRRTSSSCTPAPTATRPAAGGHRAGGRRWAVGAADRGRAGRRRGDACIWRSAGTAACRAATAATTPTAGWTGWACSPHRRLAARRRAAGRRTPCSPAAPGTWTCAGWSPRASWRTAGWSGSTVGRRRSPTTCPRRWPPRRTTLAGSARRWTPTSPPPGSTVPVEAGTRAGDGPGVASAPPALDLDNVAAVVWATGFRRDHRYIEAPVLDVDGEPVHQRGVTAAPGLYFLGLRWQSPAQLELHRRRAARRGVPGRQIARRPVERGTAALRSSPPREATDHEGPLPHRKGACRVRASTCSGGRPQRTVASSGRRSARTTATSARIAALSARRRSSTPSRSQA